MAARRRILLIAATGLALAGAAAWWAQGEGGAPAATPAAAPPRVPVAEVLVREIAEQAEYTGYLEAVEAVDLAPRVGGQLVRADVPEGAFVAAGDVLFEIDPAPFAARLQAARATLARAEALVAQARRDLGRAEELAPKGFVPRRALDDARTRLEEREAERAAARAAVRQAELDLGYTRVTAPIAGRVDRILVTRGNLVSGGDAGNATRLTRIVRTDPLFLTFDVDEATYLRLRANGAADRTVELTLASDPSQRFSGRLDFTAPEVDRGTGTVRARAVVPNPDGALKPGLFARVRLDVAPPRPTVLVSDIAIGTDQGRRFVLAVGPNDVAEYRPIEVGAVRDGLRVVRNGLKAGERVVLKGLVRPGMTITPNPVPMTSEAAGVARAGGGP